MLHQITKQFPKHVSARTEASRWIGLLTFLFAGASIIVSRPIIAPSIAPGHSIAFAILDAFAGLFMAFAIKQYVYHDHGKVRQIRGAWLIITAACATVTIFMIQQFETVSLLHYVPVSAYIVILVMLTITEQQVTNDINPIPSKATSAFAALTILGFLGSFYIIVLDYVVVQASVLFTTAHFVIAFLGIAITSKTWLMSYDAQEADAAEKQNHINIAYAVGLFVGLVIMGITMTEEHIVIAATLMTLLISHILTTVAFFWETPIIGRSGGSS